MVVIALDTDGSNGRKITHDGHEAVYKKDDSVPENSHQIIFQSQPTSQYNNSSSIQLPALRNMHFSSTIFLATLPLLIAGQTYRASITEYGAGDERGSANCNRKTTACGFFTKPGYSAAASENIFGKGDGEGHGPGCKTCWRLTGETDSSGHKLKHPKSIVIKVDDLCPADSNVLCSMKTTHDRNQYGAQVNFDLCKDSGAAAAFLGPSGVGLAVGTATRVSCKEWHGTDHYGKVPRRALELLEDGDE